MAISSSSLYHDSSPTNMFILLNIRRDTKSLQLIRLEWVETLLILKSVTQGSNIRQMNRQKCDTQSRPRNGRQE